MSLVAQSFQPKHPPSPQSLVLADQDLLALIFSAFLPEDPTALPRGDVTTRRKNLRDIALTCKSFKTPALDRLWTYLDSFLPLIKLLPDLTVIDGQYYFSGTLAEEGTFCTYAGKLRCLQVGYPNAAAQALSIAPSLSHLITQQLGGELLFPSLRLVMVHPSMQETSDTNFASQLPWILSSSIETAIFCGSGISRPLFADFCFPLVQKHLSRLVCLSLRAVEGAAPPLSVLEAVMDMDNLESLELQLPAIAMPLQQIIDDKKEPVLRNLRSLSLDLHCNSAFVQPPINDFFPKTLFPLLTDFKFVSCSGTSVCPCMPPLLRSKITCLTLSLSSHVASELAFKEVASSLANVSSLTKLQLVEKAGRKISIQEARSLAPLLSLSLQELHINLTSIAWPLGTASSFMMSALMGRPQRPLLDIRSLTLPAYLDGHPFILSNLSEIAKGLPMLEHLTLGLESRTQIESGWFKWGLFPEISGLLHHWKTCRSPSPSRLRHLSIYEQKPLNEFDNHQYNDLAQLLDLIFPHLVSITPYHEEDREAPYWKEHWWFIEHLRKMYKRLRWLETAGSK
ncbi:hypothetical protein NMY22_g1536 [Coprinellus aureogranulatus]|nr:hypothetical protein NMY22_g1536 [Coprinellus aureogranulatus]